MNEDMQGIVRQHLDREWVGNIISLIMLRIAGIRCRGIEEREPNKYKNLSVTYRMGMR